MSFHGNCPHCGTVIPQERYETGFAVCECGWFDDKSSTLRTAEVEKKKIIAMICFSLAIMAFYAHAASWGSYSLAIPLVKARQLTGTLSTQGYEELADACIGLNKWGCAREAYMDIYRSNRDARGLAELGHFEVRLGDNQAAVAAYATYFRAGGNSGEASLDYAKVLETVGQADEALKFYEASIAARPGVLPIQATSGIVRIMMKKGQYEEAYQRIVAFQTSAENAKGFLNTELAQLEAALSKTASGRAVVRKGKALLNA